MSNFFSQRKFVIATKHEKEKVIAPLLKLAFDADCIVPFEFDSDAFGTFTGEVERKNDPLETAKHKCIKAMELSGCDIGISSEGSFGPHPQLYFASADFEIIYLYDKKNNLEISSQKISTETNFNAAEIANYTEVLEFAKSALFPQHGLILRKSKDSSVDLYKDILNYTQLEERSKQLINKYGSLYIETDMRAMRNPSRMNVIKEAMEDLIKKMNSLCPMCAEPGFSVSVYEPGLPCAECGFPTQSTRAYIYNCKKCGYSEKKLFPNAKYTEDPMYCDFCNP